MRHLPEEKISGSSVTLQWALWVGVPPDYIGERQMGRYGKEVYEYVSTQISASDESPTMYINAAVKESAIRSTGALEDVYRNIFDEDDNDGSVTEEQIFSHPAVRTVLRKFPNKNVTFNLHEVQLVIALFDAVGTARNDLEGEKYHANNIVTATHTIKYARYSELVTETIVRWILRGDVVRKISGRKISVEFEAMARMEKGREGRLEMVVSYSGS